MSIAQFINIDGFRLNYYIEGKGIPAIVIGSTEYYSKTFSSNLRKHLQLIFMDHRGFAKSYPSNITNNAYELDVIVNDIEKLRAKLGLNKIVIIGHSGHGFIALEYAKQYPNNVSHVIVIATPPNLSPSSMECASKIWDTLVDDERKNIYNLDQNKFTQISANSTWNSEVFINYMLLNKAKTWYDYNFDAQFLWDNVQWNISIANYLWGTVFRDINVTKQLESIDSPILLTLGMYDFAQAPWFTWNEIISKFNNVELKLFSKSGHNPQLEQQEEFDNTLLSWLSLNNT